ncbi:MAG: HD-GYP domain-containing protein [Gammaproteobacteria bacterium]
MKSIETGYSETANKIKIDVGELRIGMYVCELDRPWLETNFWFQGFELKTIDEINAVKKTCRYVYIDTSKSHYGLSSASTGTAYTKAWLDKKSAAPEKKRSFQEEIEAAEQIHHNASTLIRSFMDDVRLGRGINTAAAKSIVAQCVQSVLNSPDALMWLTQLKHKDEYTAEHSMNVCIMAIALGRHIGLSLKELNQIGLCGMMHDMGKMRIPLGILNKPGALDREETAVMQSHTLHGMKLLISSRNMYAGAIDVAYTHHEQLDGKGYMRKLTDEHITPYAKMVAIVDMYDAITSDRVYQKGRSHLEALNIMTKASGRHLDPLLTIRFIECLGIYPPGSIVEMNNGEVGIVVEVHPKQKIRPKIILLLDEHKRPRTERLVDLSKIDLDASGQKYTIRRTARADEFGIDINRFHKNGMLHRGFTAV